MTQLEETGRDDRLARAEGAAAWEAVFESADPNADPWDVARQAAEACNDARKARGWKGPADMKNEIEEVNAKYGFHTDADTATIILAEVEGVSQ